MNAAMKSNVTTANASILVFSEIHAQEMRNVTAVTTDPLAAAHPVIPEILTTTANALNAMLTTTVPTTKLAYNNTALTRAPQLLILLARKMQSATPKITQQDAYVHPICLKAIPCRTAYHPKW